MKLTMGSEDVGLNDVKATVLGLLDEVRPHLKHSHRRALRVPSITSALWSYVTVAAAQSHGVVCRLEHVEVGPPCGETHPRVSTVAVSVLLHDVIFLVHHHCRISSNKQRHLLYPIYNRRQFLHLLADAIPPIASVALFSLPRVPVRVIAHRLSALCREGTTSSFSPSNDSKSTTAALLSLPFRSTDRSSRSSISSVEVNRYQTFTAVDNTTVSLISGQDLRPSQELDLAGA
ncbi:hypothetical protein BHM03_00022006 [Ensete ventricosum]|nr:hypothetical protein BHM03_00022006 [Ensete ventricosum]